jgi:chromate transport protein ChrA
VSLATVVAVAAFFGGIQTLAVAIVGEYVVRTYREAQGRPSWLIRRRLNDPVQMPRSQDTRAA